MKPKTVENARFRVEQKMLKKQQKQIRKLEKNVQETIWLLKMYNWWEQQKIVTKIKKGSTKHMDRKEEKPNKFLQYRDKEIKQTSNKE